MSDWLHEVCQFPTSYFQLFCIGRWRVLLGGDLVEQSNGILLLRKGLCDFLVTPSAFPLPNSSLCLVVETMFIISSQVSETEDEGNIVIKSNVCRCMQLEILKRWQEHAENVMIELAPPRQHQAVHQVSRSQVRNQVCTMTSM